MSTKRFSMSWSEDEMYALEKVLGDALGRTSPRSERLWLMRKRVSGMLIRREREAAAAAAQTTEGREP